MLDLPVSTKRESGEGGDEIEHFRGVEIVMR
jgi:hypothetical protein